MNYTLAEYASDVVYRIANVCNARGIEHPVIVSESGRAIAAHHSVLVFNVLGSSRLDKLPRHRRRSSRRARDTASACRSRCSDLLDAYRSIIERRLVECYHDALQAREQALQMFNLGYLGLEVARPRRAAVLGDLRQDPRPVRASLPRCRRSSRVSRRCSATSTSATSRCSSRCRTAGRSTSCSRSCRSTGSTSGRSRNGVLADITCDSDGKIDHFVSQRDIKRTLELHDLRRRRKLLPRRLPGRRVPGNARRPAQPVRRHARRAHQAARRRRLVDRGDGQGRHRHRGARVHAATTSSGCSRSSRAIASARCARAGCRWPRARRSSGSMSPN